MRLASIGGLGIPQLLHLNQRNEVFEVCSLPTGTHNARRFRDGAVFNDTASDAIRYVGRDDRNQAFAIKTYPESALEFAGIDDSKIARQAFGRGLCVADERFIARGSSPSTITFYESLGQSGGGPLQHVYAYS